RVSSVLNKDNANYGKQHLTDRSVETCWNSDQGSPQFIVVDFGRSVHVDAIHLTFQGGFVGSPCQVLANAGSDGTTTLAPFWTAHPEDSNAAQVFEVPQDLRGQRVSRIKLVFPSSSDFYGRVTVYNLDFVGRE
ncbi:galactose-binding domain-like protein, partial [Catenaria anguillulae PL171]